MENGVRYEYKNCPIKFIPSGVIKFMRVYDFHKNFPGSSMPSYEEINPKFVSAYQYYESKLAEFTREKMSHG